MTTVKIANIPSSVEGQKLNTVIWECENPKAILQIAHGMAEHIMRYDHFARWLNENGITVVGNSHLGHGNTAASEKELGYFAKKNGWEHVVEDIHIVRSEMTERYPNVPYFILGHSMGSFVLRTYLCTEKADGLAGAVISGTGDVPGAVAGALKGMSSLIGFFCGKKHRSKLINSMSFGSYNKPFKPADTPYDWLTKDENIVKKYIADGRCGFIFTCSAYKDLGTGLKFIRKKKNIKKMNKETPILFIAGDKDPVGSQGAGVQNVYDRFCKIGMKDVEIKLYENDRHEVLNETDKENVYKKCLEFIKCKIK